MCHVFLIILFHFKVNLKLYFIKSVQSFFEPSNCELERKALLPDNGYITYTYYRKSYEIVKTLI